MEAQNASHSAAWFADKLAQRFWQRIRRELLVLLLFGFCFLVQYILQATPDTNPKGRDNGSLLALSLICGWYHFQTLFTLSVQKIFTQPPHSNTGVTQRAFQCF